MLGGEYTIFYEWTDLEEIGKLDHSFRKIDNGGEKSSAGN